MKIYIDFETFSKVDLKKSSVINYIKDSSFEVLCLCYAVDDGEVIAIEGGFNYTDYNKLDKILKKADTIIAHNAFFDVAVWNLYIVNQGNLVAPIDINRVSCTMLFARYLRLPEKLKDIAIYANVEQLKDESGIDLFKEIKRHKGVYYNIPKYIIDQLILYCSQDVRALRDIYKKMESSIPFNELLVMRETLKINFRGLPINTNLIKNWSLAIKTAKDLRAKELKEITNGRVETSNQTQRIKDMFKLSGKLEKRDCEMLLKSEPKGSLLSKVLHIRLLYASSSMNRILTSSERVHEGRFFGALSYHKAHTGRWASVGLQVQNMPRSKVDNVFLNASLSGDIEYLKSLYNLPKLVKEHFRYIISSEDKKIIAIDYSKIEYLVMRWLVKDHKAIKGYDEGIDFYKITAGKLFNKDPDEINKVERWVGKIAELSLQYQIGAEKFKAQIIQENPNIIEFIPGDIDDFAKSTLSIWRTLNIHIQNLWNILKLTLIECYNNPNKSYTYVIDRDASIVFKYISKTLSLVIKLPSSRMLIYRDFKVLGDNKLSYRDLSLNGMEYYLYGGKITNHLVQAIARDILANVLIENPDLPIISLAHDEIVFEGGDPDEFNKKVLKMPKWFNAQLKSEIKIGNHYK